MRITVIRMLVFLASCVSIWFTLRKFKENTLGFRSMLVWVILFFAIAVSSIFPEVPDSVSPIMGMKNRMFFVLLVGMLVLYALLFNVTSRLDKIERNIRKLVQDRALDDLPSRLAGSKKVVNSASKNEVREEAARQEGSGREAPGEGSE